MNKFYLPSGLHGTRVLTVYEREKVLMHVSRFWISTNNRTENVTRKVKAKSESGNSAVSGGKLMVNPWHKC